MASSNQGPPTPQSTTAALNTKINSWCHTTFDEYQFSHRWTIANYSDRTRYNGFNIVLQCPSFTPEGKPNEQWAIHLIPSQPSGNPLRQHVGVYVCLVDVSSMSSTPSPKMWIKYKLSIPSSINSDKEVAREVSTYTQVIKGQRCGFGAMVLKDTLLKPDEGYVVNDTLTIYCTIFVKLLDTPKHTVGTVFPFPAQQIGLLGKMNEARQKGLYTDVVLVADSKEFKAHRAVLAVQSSFFNTRFQERWDQGESKIQMTDVSPSTLESILEFLYMGHCDINSTNAEVLLAAAHEYGLESLQLMCEQQLCLELKIENVLLMLVLADTHQAQHLKVVCLDFCVVNSSLLLGSTEWKELKKSKQHEELRMEVLEELLNRKN